jgi:hypothetical protein
MHAFSRGALGSPSEVRDRLLAMRTELSSDSYRQHPIASYLRSPESIEAVLPDPPLRSAPVSISPYRAHKNMG